MLAAGHPGGGDPAQGRRLGRPVLARQVLGRAPLPADPAGGQAPGEVDHRHRHLAARRRPGRFHARDLHRPAALVGAEGLARQPRLRRGLDRARRSSPAALLPTPCCRASGGAGSTPSDSSRRCSTAPPRTSWRRQLDSTDPKQVLYALDLFGASQGGATHPALRDLLGHEEPAVRQRALELLDAAGDLWVLPRVEEMLRDPRPRYARRPCSSWRTTRHSIRSADPGARRLSGRLGHVRDRGVPRRSRAITEQPPEARLLLDRMIAERGEARKGRAARGGVAVGTLVRRIRRPARRPARGRGSRGRAGGGPCRGKAAQTSSGAEADRAPEPSRGCGRRRPTRSSRWATASSAPCATS